MIEFSGVGVTDEVNLYDQRFTLRALYSAYEDIWNEGVPSFFNHDHRKHLGWTKLSGIYLEPHTAYVTNTIYVGENENECKLLQDKSYNQIFKIRVTDRIDKYNELKSRLGTALTDKATPCWVNAVSFFDQGIVRRVLPQLSTEMVKGLIPIKNLNYVQPGIYERDGWLLFAHKYFRRGLSYLNTLNEPFLELLQKCDDSLQVKIAIDMDCIGLLGTEEREMEYQYWWGPKFRDDLDSIPAGVTVYKNEYYDGLLSEALQTEFGWYIQDGIRTFECEELTDIENLSDDKGERYGCRFVHSMVSDKTHLPYHLDGAIRAYTFEKMANRLDVDIKHSGRDTQYTKIWRIDGNIEIALWKELIAHYYRDNMQVGEYFNGVDTKLDLVHTEQTNHIEAVPKISLESFIPLTMSDGDGLRINISCVPIESIPEQFDVIIRPTQFYSINNKVHKFYESDTLSVVKYLTEQNYHVRIPYCDRVATEDMVYNFPLFVCKNISSATAIVKCFEQLCEAWNAHSDDRLISYSILINYESKGILLSFAGHIKDFEKWYNYQSSSVPLSEDSVVQWLEKAYGFLNTFKAAHNIPRISQLKIKGGILSFPKKFVESRFIENLEKDDHGIYAHLKLKEDEYQIIKENNIWICAMYNVKESTCSECGHSYAQCPCQKFLMPNVTEFMKDCKLVGFIWTNRSAMVNLKASKSIELKLQ